MIHFTVLNSSADMKRYYGSPDYYIDGQETHAFFGGKLAERLGLKAFDLQAFHDLCDGYVPGSRRIDPRTGKIDPLSGEQLTPGRKENKRAGWDVTVDGPKDLGVLMALGLDHRIIPEALERAGRDVMAEIEKDAKTRVRVGRQDTDRETGEIVYTGVLHTTSRPVGDKIDVQPHYHFLVANATFDPVEKRMKALQLQPYAANGAKEARPYYTAYFNAKLAGYMQGLGYEVEKTKDSFRVVGVPERVRKEFSQRTSVIEKVAAQLERRKQAFMGDPDVELSPEVKGRLGAHTREKKQPAKTWDGLLAHWNGRVTPEEKRAVMDTVIRSHREPVTPVLDNRAALDWAILHAFERDSVVSERELATHALKHGLGSVEPEGVLAELKAHPGLIRRGDKVTTNEVLAEERRVLDYAIDGRGRCRPLGERGAKPLEWLSKSQADAVRHIWESPDRLMLVRGLAGVGKTTALKAALDGVTVPVVAVAPSAEASRGQLRDAGIEGAETLARFLVDEKLQEEARGGLIVLDEGSLAGAKDVARLSQLAGSLDARVLILGDRRQHKSVSRGDMLAMLEDRAGLPVIEVSDIKRQGGEYKRAVEALARGDVATGFKRLDELGWVKEAGPGQSEDGKPQTPHEQIAADYLQAMKDGKSVLVVSPTHAEGDAITVTLRDKLKAEGKLHGEEREFQALVPLHLTEAERSDPASYQPGMVAQFHRPGGGFRAGARVDVSAGNVSALSASAAKHGLYAVAPLRLAVGDSVRITGNGKDVTGKHRLNNGTVYEVAGFDDTGNIRLGNGWTIKADYGHLAHGYVSTSHAAQGKTVDRVLVSMNPESFPAAGAEQFYVSVSRGRQQATVYTSDREGLKEVIKREDKRMTAHDLVGKPKKRRLRDRVKKHLAFLQRAATFRPEPSRDMTQQQQRGMEYGR